MRGFNKVLLWAVVATICVGCADTEFDSPSSGNKISFLTATYDTRAASYNPDNKGANYITTMGVYAAATGSADYNETQHAINLFDQGTKVSRPDIKGEWTYGGTEYWPVGKTTFFGYSPYDANGTNISIPAVGTPNITFNVTAHPANQVDLLIATPQTNKTKNDRVVTMPFKHALTKISFAAKLSHDPSETPNFDWAKIARIEVKGVYTQGTHSMDATTEWQNLEFPNLATAPFAVSIEDNDDNNLLNGGLENVELTTQYQQITTNDGYLFMLPQSLKGDRGTNQQPLYAKVKVYVTAGFNGQNGDQLFTTPIEFNLELTGLDWKQGEAVNYLINVDISSHVTNNSTIKAQLVDWDNVTVNGQIINRQLNVTRLEAKVHGGSVTRVHFWSDQPCVWIDEKLYQGNANDYTPNESNNPVNNVFKDIASSIVYDTGNYSPTNATNFHYDPNTGKGYFDVENITNMGNPVNENYIIYLCASNTEYDKELTKPLMRSIRLNRILQNIPASSDISTPYVGSLHRHNQVGERIITWNNSGMWTAVIMDTPCEDASGTPHNDYKSVLIDRLISPAQETGILYTSNPGDAENYKVSTWSSEIGSGTINGKRWVSGNDKVYLRIGWNEKNPNISRNRYAIINIYSGVIDNESQLGDAQHPLKATLYIRQGEDADYIMRNGEEFGGVASGMTRDCAMKWSPYNLCDKNHVTENNIFNYNVLPFSGSGFAEFPTMAGTYFRWGETRPIPASHVNAGNLMSIWQQSYLSPDTWIAEEMDVAPPGYRIPQYKRGVSTLADKNNFTQRLLIEDNELLHSLAQSIYAHLGLQLELGLGKPNVPGLKGNDIGNWTFGYYADGYFDRGSIDQKAGSATQFSRVHYKDEAGYHGALVFNPKSLSSLFFPYTGHVVETGTTILEGQMLYLMTSTSGPSVTIQNSSTILKTAWMFVSAYGFQNKPGEEFNPQNTFFYADNGSAAVVKSNAYSYRCVIDNNPPNIFSVTIQGTGVDRIDANANYGGTSYVLSANQSNSFTVTLPSAGGWKAADGDIECIGWSETKGSKTIQYNFNAQISNINRNINLFPVFKALYVTVTFDANGATSFNQSYWADEAPNRKGKIGTRDYTNLKTGNSNINATFPSINSFTATKDGKMVKKWNTKADGTGTSYNVNDPMIFKENEEIYYAIYE